MNREEILQLMKDAAELALNTEGLTLGPGDTKSIEYLLDQWLNSAEVRVDALRVGDIVYNDEDGLWVMVDGIDADPHFDSRQLVTFRGAPHSWGKGAKVRRQRPVTTGRCTTCHRDAHRPGMGWQGHHYTGLSEDVERAVEREQEKR